MAIDQDQTEIANLNQQHAGRITSFGTQNLFAGQIEF